MKTRLLTVLAVLLVASFVSAQDPQFALVGGSAQIGHMPGRVDLLHPSVRSLLPGQHVSFRFTLRSLTQGNPCAVDDGCKVAIGFRDTEASIDSVWSTFAILPVEAQPVMAMELPSTAGDVLPLGNHCVFVRFTRGTQTLLEFSSPVVIRKP